MSGTRLRKVLILQRRETRNEQITGRKVLMVPGFILHTLILRPKYGKANTAIAKVRRLRFVTSPTPASL